MTVSTQWDGGRIRKENVLVKGRAYPRYMVDLGRVEGKRYRRSFKTRREASEFVREFDRRRDQVGSRASTLTRQATHDATRALEILGGEGSLVEAASFYSRYGKELGEEGLDDALKAARVLDGQGRLARAAELYLDSLPNGAKSLTVDEAIREYVAECERHNLRPASMQDLRNRLGRFSKAFGGRSLNEVSRQEVAKWLSGLRTRRGAPLAAISQRHFRVVCGGLYNFALDREYVRVNPFQQKSRSRRKRQEDAVMPGIMSPADVARVMEAASEHRCLARADGVRSMVPAFALGFFAGIRTSELQRLTWAEVDLEVGRLTVTPAAAKKLPVRYIDVEDNLRDWLLPLDGDDGWLVPQGAAWRTDFDAVRKTAGLREHWPTNCMRHCFASYHLVKYGDRRRTEMMLGHRSEDLLYNHYRALATPDEAEAFFSIRP